MRCRKALRFISSTGPDGRFWVAARPPRDRLLLRSQMRLQMQLASACAICRSRENASRTRFRHSPTLSRGEALALLGVLIKHPGIPVSNDGSDRSAPPRTGAWRPIRECSSRRFPIGARRLRCCCGRRIAMSMAAQKQTLANLSKLPVDLIGGLKALLKGGTVIGAGPDEIQIERSLPHGHVAAALGMIRKIALDRLILSTTKDQASRRHCDLVVAMIVDRLIAPRSKLGFVRAVDQETAISSLGPVLRLGKGKEREAYEALDWLVERQSRIENVLAR